MATWTFAQIQDEVRYLTGLFSESDLSTSDLQLQINRAYQFVLPADAKLERNYTTYSFLTTENQPYYSIAGTSYTNLVPPAKIDNKDLLWEQSPSVFIELNGINYSEFQPWTGDGSTSNFSTTLSGLPMFPGTFYATDETEVFEDTTTTYTSSNVTLTGSEGGTATINYLSGSISLTFNTPPTNGQAIILKYIVMTTGQPESALMFNNRIEFFPVPDTAYRFTIQAYNIPTELSLPTDTPALQEWGPAISTCTAKEIFRRLGRMKGYAEMTALYKEQINQILTRTVQTLSNERAYPKF